MTLWVTERRRPFATARAASPAGATRTTACEWRLRVGAGGRIRIAFSTLRVWAGDTLTVHAESYKGLVADALVAKLVTAPTGGVTLRRSARRGHRRALQHRCESEGFYNEAAVAEDNDGFVASFVRAEVQRVL